MEHGRQGAEHRRRPEVINRSPVADRQYRAKDRIVKQGEVDLKAEDPQTKIAYRAARTPSRQQPDGRTKGKRAEGPRDGDKPVLRGRETALRDDIAPENAIAKFRHLPAKGNDGEGMGQFMNQDARRNTKKECCLLGQAFFGDRQRVLADA